MTCKYAEKCQWYSKTAVTCNENDGWYGHGFASCYMKMKFMKGEQYDKGKNIKDNKRY